MVCQSCKKHPASVHLTEIINQSVTQELHLCEACARQKGLVSKFNITPPTLLALTGEALKAVQAQQAAHAAGEKDEPAERLSCPACGITFADFRGKGRLGCSHDYTAFREALLPILDKIHHGVQHRGKMPRTHAPPANVQRMVADLERELERCVGSEEFEKAAQLRDQIRKLRTSEP